MFSNGPAKDLANIATPKTSKREYSPPFFAQYTECFVFNFVSYIQNQCIWIVSIYYDIFFNT